MLFKTLKGKKKVLVNRVDQISWQGHFKRQDRATEFTKLKFGAPRIQTESSPAFQIKDENVVVVSLIEDGAIGWVKLLVSLVIEFRPCPGPKVPKFTAKS